MDTFWSLCNNHTFVCVADNYNFACVHITLFVRITKVLSLFSWPHFWCVCWLHFCLWADDHIFVCLQNSLLFLCGKQPHFYLCSADRTWYTGCLKTLSWNGAFCGHSSLLGSYHTIWYTYIGHKGMCRDYREYFLCLTVQPISPTRPKTGTQSNHLYTMAQLPIDLSFYCRACRGVGCTVWTQKNFLYLIYIPWHHI